MENLVVQIAMFKTLESSYKGKKVFVTGHTGFKGSWLLKTLSILGADIAGYALAPYTDDDLYHLIDGDSLCSSTIADIRDKDRLHKALLDFQPDFVFHLAAQPLVRLSYEIPAETFEVNAIGTANILDAVRQLKKKCSVVLITTDKVYHNNEWIHPYRENDRLGGYDPYSASKACAELVINSYRNSFFNLDNYLEHKKAIAVTRAGNVIGGGDWSKDRLIPDIIRSLIKEEVITIRNPNAIRPWQHVIEPVVGYLLLGTKLSSDPIKYAQAYNFGPYSIDALPVIEMVDLAINFWGNGNYEIKQESDQVHEAGLLKLDISKAETELSWKPKMNSSQAVQLTTSWYKMFRIDRKNINFLTKDQILDYLNA